MDTKIGENYIAMESVKKLLEVMQSWCSFEKGDSAVLFLMVYAAMAQVEDGGLFSEMPYVDITGDRDSKKTQAATLAIDLVGDRNAVNINAGLTPAVLFRMLDQVKAKLLVIDEADEITAATAKEIKRIARTGYRPGAKVYRCEGRTAVKSYAVYGPKIFTRIQFEDDAALRDRMLELRTKPSRESKFIFTQSQRDAAVEEVRVLLEQFAEAERLNVIALYQEAAIVPNGIYGRLASICRPLIAVARRLDACWPGLGFENAVQTIIREEWDRRLGLADFESRRVIKSLLRMFLESGNEAVESPDIFTRKSVQDFLVAQDASFGRITTNVFTRNLYHLGFALRVKRRSRVGDSNPLRLVKLNIKLIREGDGVERDSSGDQGCVGSTEPKVDNGIVRSGALGGSNELSR